MSTSYQCATCRHYRVGMECEAYPDGIPEVIWRGDHDHREPYKGDDGIQWEPVEKKRSPRPRHPGVL